MDQQKKSTKRKQASPFPEMPADRVFPVRWENRKANRSCQSDLLDIPLFDQLRTLKRPRRSRSTASTPGILGGRRPPGGEGRTCSSILSYAEGPSEPRTVRRTVPTNHSGFHPRRSRERLALLRRQRNAVEWQCLENLAPGEEI
jgi:hypothetical protein